MTTHDQIEAFLASPAFAVAGASSDRSKYGNKVFRALLASGRKVFPINPNQTEVEGHACYPDLKSLPVPCLALSIVTPPQVTEQLVPEAAAAGVKYVWMQPGAESPAAIAAAQKLGLETIAGGPCVLVTLSQRLPGGLAFLES